MLPVAVAVAYSGRKWLINERRSERAIDDERKNGYLQKKLDVGVKRSSLMDIVGLGPIS